MHIFHRFDQDTVEPPYLLINIYRGSHGRRAAIFKSDDLPEDGYTWPDAGCDAEAALSWAENYSGASAINVYVQLQDAEWDPSWGELVD
jgi:hypothetical protein